MDFGEKVKGLLLLRTENAKISHMVRNPNDIDETEVFVKLKDGKVVSQKFETSQIEEFDLRRGLEVKVKIGTVAGDVIDILESPAIKANRNKLELKRT